MCVVSLQGCRTSFPLLFLRIDLKKNISPRQMFCLCDNIKILQESASKLQGGNLWIAHACSIQATEFFNWGKNQANFG